MPECYASSERVDSLARVVITPVRHTHTRLHLCNNLENFHLSFTNIREIISRLSCECLDNVSKLILRLFGREKCLGICDSSFTSHQEVLLAQFSLYVHKCGLKPDSFHFVRKQSQHLNIITLNIIII